MNDNPASATFSTPRTSPQSGSENGTMKSTQTDQPALDNVAPITYIFTE
jgi:hypothetical protein